MFNGYFIQYKFIIPESMKHSSYTYQKLFRALYGYTQAVTKSNGKNYTYHREGVLSNIPYVRPGKNCVIIPKESLSILVDFFKTGRNPAHKWHIKGDWKAVYYMDEKNIDEQMATKALEGLVERKYVSLPEQGYTKLNGEIDSVLELVERNEEGSDSIKISIIEGAKAITGLPWFKKCAQNSQKLREFNDKLGKLRNL